MRSFQQHLPDFTARGIRVVAISTDPTEVTKRHCEKRGFTFTFLSDPTTETIKKFGLLHPGGGPGGADIARPAEFLVDPTGTIRWVNLTGSITVRARPEQALKAYAEWSGSTRR